MRAPHHDSLLEQYLSDALGPIEPDAMAAVREHVEWRLLDGGETLMAQGDVGDAMYLVVSGRLRVYVNDTAEPGPGTAVREIGRGQVVGEISLYTGEPRSATVVAVRDSVLVRLAKPAFDHLVDVNPRLTMALTRLIIDRLQTEHQRPTLPRPVAVGLVGITPGLDLPAFAAALADGLARCRPDGGRVEVVTSARMQALSETGSAPGGAGHAAGGDDDGGAARAQRAIAIALDRLEAASDVVLLVADPDAGAWAQRVLRHSDEILLLADADAPPAPHPAEALRAAPPRQHSEAAATLVLLHPADRVSPRGTAAWLADRDVAGHVHLRRGHAPDLARLARLLSRTAVGLVLAGGGARGFAHLGVVQALRERGVEVDCVGGTSMGAVMAACVASARSMDDVLAFARRAFRTNPTGDYNLLPLLSLIKGRRLQRVLEDSVRSLVGHDADIEDLWLGCYCIATNYSQAREMVVQRGNLVGALRASTAIPGALPPVLHDGDLLCDGGTFNNFPADVMRSMRGVGTVIGVDLNPRPPRRIELAALPGSWQLLRDRLRPRARRRYHLPTLASYLMTVTILYSVSRQREARRLADLCFAPPLERVGLLQWDRFDDIVTQGHAHGVAVLAALPPALRARLLPAETPVRPAAASAEGAR